MYGVERLKIICEDVLQKGLKIDNVANLLQTAEDLRYVLLLSFPPSLPPFLPPSLPPARPPCLVTG